MAENGRPTAIAGERSKRAEPATNTPQLGDSLNSCRNARRRIEHRYKPFSERDFGSFDSLNATTF
jgi:hypothetical protein